MFSKAISLQAVPQILSYRKHPISLVLHIVTDTDSTDTDTVTNSLSLD